MKGAAAFAGFEKTAAAAALGLDWLVHGGLPACLPACRSVGGWVGGWPRRAPSFWEGNSYVLSRE